MSDLRDPLLERLFDEAGQESQDDQFVDQVMQRVDSLRRRVVIGWVIAGLALVTTGWLFSAPLHGTVNLLTQVMPTSLIEVKDGWIAQLLAPLNSVAAIVAVGFFASRSLYKKIFA